MDRASPPARELPPFQIVSRLSQNNLVAAKNN